MNRIGARAFFTLKGYAGRKRRNGVGSATADARPPSRFSSEIGTKADAKQVDRASLRVCGLKNRL
jgi:hypothetical protein